MAKLQPQFEFTGSLGNLSAYRRKDTEGIILRSKGGPSREKIRSNPTFEGTRRNNREFGGRSSFSGFIRRGLHSLKPLADYNWAGPLNTLLRKVQEGDTVNEWGRRSICLSASPGILEGFPLNRRNIFEAVVRSPLSVAASREESEALIILPALYPAVNFFPVDHYPVFRWQAGLALVPDLHYKQGKGYVPSVGLNAFHSAHREGAWCHSRSGAEGQEMTLQLPEIARGEGYSLVLAVGISFGTVRAEGSTAAPYAGTGKIVKVV